MQGITTKQNSLKVSLLDISPHNKAILEFFFAGAGSRLFTVTGSADADIFIVDFDHPNAKQNWEKTNAVDKKPTLALAFYEVDIENVVWLAKPLSIQSLTQAAAKVHELLDKDGGSQTEVSHSTPSSESSAVKRPSATSAFSIKALADEAKKKAIKPVVKPTAIPPKMLRPEKKLVASVTETEKQSSAPAQREVSASKLQKNAPKSLKPKSSKPVISLEEKQKRWEKLCGNEEDIKNVAAWKSELALYTPENYLISSLQDALRLAIQSQQLVQIKYQAVIFNFMPKANQAYSSVDITSDEFENLCKTPVKKADVYIHIMTEKEVESANKVSEARPNGVYDLEGFIWTSMLLTSSGKLHRNVDLKKRVMLRHWPNFTRIETFPHVVRISALWSNDAFNMLEVAHNLDIPQRYVFAFYNASCVLGLIEHSPDKLKTRIQHTQEKPQNKNRGLFSRLLNRLLG